MRAWRVLSSGHSTGDFWLGEISLARPEADPSVAGQVCGPLGTCTLPLALIAPPGVVYVSEPCAALHLRGDAANLFAGPPREDDCPQCPVPGVMGRDIRIRRQMNSDCTILSEWIMST